MTREFIETFLEQVRREAARRSGIDPGAFTLGPQSRLIARYALTLINDPTDISDGAPHYLFEAAVHTAIADYMLRCAEAAH